VTANAIPPVSSQQPKKLTLWYRFLWTVYNCYFVGQGIPCFVESPRAHDKLHKRKSLLLYQLNPDQNFTDFISWIYFILCSYLCTVISSDPLPFHVVALFCLCLSFSSLSGVYIKCLVLLILKLLFKGCKLRLPHDTISLSLKLCVLINLMLCKALCYYLNYKLLK
jgi:hypothetical protein